MATLTRAQMEQVIRDGGSVLHGGQIITKITNLPTEAALAAGNPAAEAAAAASLQAQMAALQAQMDALKPSSAQAATPSTPTYDAMSEALGEVGFATPEDVRAASDDELLSVPGIGPATLKKLRAEMEA